MFRPPAALMSAWLLCCAGWLVPSTAHAETKVAGKPALTSDADCIRLRVKRQEIFLEKVMQAPKGSKFDWLRDANNRNFAIAKKCRYAFASSVDKALGQACMTGYLRSIEAMKSSDDATEQGCAQIAKAAESVKSCQKGQADCLRMAADEFDKAKPFLQKGREDAVKSMELLEVLHKHALTVSKGYSWQLSAIGNKLVELKLNGKPLNDPELDAQTRKTTGFSLQDVMNQINVPDMDPDKVLHKAQELQLRDERYARDKSYRDGLAGSAEAKTTFDNEYGAASATGNASALAQGFDRDFRGEESTITGSSTYYRRLADNFRTAPDQPSSPPAQKPVNPVGTSGPAAGSTKTAEGPPAEPTGMTSVSSASRLPSFSASGGDAKTASPADRPLAFKAGNDSAARGPVLAPASSRAVGSSPLGSTGTPAELAALPEPAAHRLAAADTTAPIAASPATAAVPNLFVAVSAFVGAPANAAGQGASNVTAGPVPDVAAPALAPASLATAKAETGETAKARAEAFADAEIAKLERTSGPVAPSLRDMLRKRLAEDFAKKLDSASAGRVPAGDNGSADAVAGLLRQVNERDAWARFEGSSAFRMLASDTEAEVRRLTGGMDDRENAPEADLGSVDVSLFHRIHDAHRRRFKAVR